MSEALHIARILARRDGLGDHMPDSSLKGWMGHAEVMADYVRERVADAYKLASGKDIHASDCATSNAPAMEPGPCDCGCTGGLLEALIACNNRLLVKGMIGDPNDEAALAKAKAAMAKARGLS